MVLWKNMWFHQEIALFVNRLTRRKKKQKRRPKKKQRKKPRRLPRPRHLRWKYYKSLFYKSFSLLSPMGLLCYWASGTETEWRGSSPSAGRRWWRLLWWRYTSQWKEHSFCGKYCCFMICWRVCRWLLTTAAFRWKISMWAIMFRQPLDPRGCCPSSMHLSTHPIISSLSYHFQITFSFVV